MYKCYLQIDISAACERLAPACSFQCVSGCFCRTPYVLSDMHDVNSACILPQHCEIQGHKNPFEPEPTLIPEMKGFIPESTTSTPEKEEPEITTTSSSIKCEDDKKEFLTCASSCPLACDNLNPQVCTPCVGGCFCKNGFVFESVNDWANAKCVKIEECSKLTNSSSPPTSSPVSIIHSVDSSSSAPTSTTSSPSPASSSMDGGETEAIGARVFSVQGHAEIGVFLFSTALDQKIRFDARINYLPYTESKTFVLTIHKYGSLSTDPTCESIGEIVEINPVYTYPYPNGTMLYLKDVKVPYASSYTFEATSDFAARSVGAVIGRSLALHAILEDSSGTKVGPSLGCGTIGILKG